MRRLVGRTLEPAARKRVGEPRPEPDARLDEPHPAADDREQRGHEDAMRPARVRRAVRAREHRAADRGPERQERSVRDRRGATRERGGRPFAHALAGVVPHPGRRGRARDEDAEQCRWKSGHGINASLAAGAAGSFVRIACVGSIASQPIAAATYRTATLRSGASHEPRRSSEMPTTSGLTAPPRLPNMFMAPLTTPACEPPSSTDTAHAGATPSAPSPAAAAKSHAEVIGLAVSTAPTTAAAASGKPRTPATERPRRDPRRRASRSLIQPPTKTPAAIATSGSAASQPTGARSKPRARSRYVGSHVR